MMAALPAHTAHAAPQRPAVPDIGSLLVGSGGIAVLLLASVAARLMTYDAVADGVFESYVWSVAIAGLSAMVVAALLAWQFTPAHLWASAGLILTLLPGDAWHYIRLWSATQSAQAEVIFQGAFEGSFLDPTRWQTELGRRAVLAVSEGRVRVQTPAGSIGWLEPLLGLERTPSPPRPWQPAGLRERQPDFTIEWETRFRLAGEFYILVEALNRDGRQLLLQARPGDWHLTHPTADGKTVGSEIADPIPGESEWHKLVMDFGPSGTSLAIDGRDVWSGVPLEFLKRVRFGETRTDDLHGGEMEVRRVRISQITRPDPVLVASQNRAPKE